MTGVSISAGLGLGTANAWQLARPLGTQTKNDTMDQKGYELVNYWSFNLSRVRAGYSQRLATNSPLGTQTNMGTMGN